MRKKLIEVALPLEAINREAAREKSIRHGHPSTLHLWWARRPLAACRAVIFGSLVDDPSSYPDKFPTVEAQEKERKRLFDIIERMVKWENANNEHVLKEVRDEILRSTNGKPPAIYDPFCGGGSIPLEAQRLGLKAYGSDLNPVAVLITKALIEIPSKFAGMPPVNPTETARPIKSGWRGVQGLTSDVSYYAQWMRDEAEKHVGKYYPKATLPKEYGGGEATVIAWIWARTVKCPNPACGAMMPLVKSFWLSSKKGKETWLEPIVDKVEKTIRFRVRAGSSGPQEPPKLARGAKFKCICCEQAAPEDHIKSEGTANRMETQLLAVVAEGKRGRIYLDPDDVQLRASNVTKPDGVAEEELPHDPRNIWCTKYGVRRHRDLYSSRQLLTLSVLSDLIQQVHTKVVSDITAANEPDTTSKNVAPSKEYADAIAVYLSLLVSKLADMSNAHCAWEPIAQCPRHLFSRQAIPMVWDYAEGNPFSDSSGSWTTLLDNLKRSLSSPLFDFTRIHPGEAFLNDATEAKSSVPSQGAVISTDPPYYDNISYADLSDFFYVWLRRSLKDQIPALFATLTTPKTKELVASPYRFDGGAANAELFFESGFHSCLTGLAKTHDSEFPLSLFYAFKQAEDSDDAGEDELSRVSTGWERMLEGLLQAGYLILATLPTRTEMSSRQIAQGTNALASSIVLVCRLRPENATIVTRREFINLLKQELPDALAALKHATIAATDLAQAAIGPGMAVFSRYSKVMEADGTTMKVRTALALINQVLDEVNSESEGDFDPDSRWAITWFETHGFEEGLYGEAETLSKAKNTSASGLVEAGIITSKAGKVKLIPVESLPEDWDPKADSRLTVWEATHHLIRVLEQKGEEGAAALLKDMGAFGEVARDLAYRLYSICERKKWAKDALRYNGLIVSWSGVSSLSQQVVKASPNQTALPFGEGRA